MSRPCRSVANFAVLAVVAAVLADLHFVHGAPAAQNWALEWPAADFSKHTVPLTEIRSGGPAKDGIPAIDAPRFEPLDAGRATGWARAIADSEPVISLVIAGEARAYPVRVLMWHENIFC